METDKINAIKRARILKERFGPRVFALCKMAMDNRGYMLESPDPRVKRAFLFASSMMVLQRLWEDGEIALQKKD